MPKFPETHTLWAAVNLLLLLLVTASVDPDVVPIRAPRQTKVDSAAAETSSMVDLMVDLGTSTFVIFEVLEDAIFASMPQRREGAADTDRQSKCGGLTLKTTGQETGH